MPRWKKNEVTAAKRRVLIAAYDSDGALADPRHTFTGTNERLVDPSTGVFAVPGGTLVNATMPLVAAPFTFTTTHATELVNRTAHNRRTGDGPFQLTTVGVKASLDVSGPGSATLNTVIEATTEGTGGNSLTIAFTAGGSGTGVLSRIGNAFTFTYATGVTTVGNFEGHVTALAGADDLIGVRTPGTAANLITSPGDTFTATALAGGVTAALPAGYALATDYWWITLGVNAGHWASSLANALTTTPVAITTDGTGTHTATAQAAAKRLVDGHWTYTASQAEINIDGYFAVRLEKEATTGASSNYQETAGVVTLTGTGFLPRHVGRRITIAGAANAANNGEFTIASYVSATAVTFANPGAIDEVLAMTFVIDDAVRPVTMSIDVYVPEGDEIVLGSHTRNDLLRGDVALLGGPALDFTTGTLTFKCPITGVTRWIGTKDATGRLTATAVDLITQ